MKYLRFKVKKNKYSWDYRSEHSRKILALTDLQLKKVLELAHLRIEANPQLRYGQAIYNQLYTFHPEIAKAIRATHRDIFFIDSRIVSTLYFITGKINFEDEQLQINLPSI